MSYELLLVPRAEAEVARIVRFLSLRSPQGATAWLQQWSKVLAEIQLQPLSYGLAPNRLKKTATFARRSSKPNAGDVIERSSK